MKSILFKKKNKKAWLRIVEAIIAIMIISGAVLVIFSKQTKKTDISEVVYEKERNILEIIANREDLRKEVINDTLVQKPKTEEFIRKNLPNNWNFLIKVCNIEKICNSADTPKDRDVYVSETIISSTLTSYPNKKLRKLRFFIWKNNLSNP